MPAPIAVASLSTTDIPGVPGTLVAPIGKVLPLQTTVITKSGPVATEFSPVVTHGNPKNPKAPGFNPECGATEIAVTEYPNVLVMGKPIAHVGAICFCGHFVITGMPDILVGP
jgi:uncharacterized Zn-binding protein involved in type VI secretion